MDWKTGTYLACLVISVGLTVWVARTLARNGTVFLLSVFGDSEELAQSVNRLLVVGFYLVNLGFVALALRSDTPVTGLTGSIEQLSLKLGLVLPIVAVLHLANVLVLNHFRRQRPAAAAAGGVSVGNAYYYYESKEHLIQAYYEQIGTTHRALAMPRLADTRPLADRLRIALRTHLEVCEPYRAFAGGFFKVAADPRSPLSPFSPQSAVARDEAIDFFATVVDGSSARMPAALRAELP